MQGIGPYGNACAWRVHSLKFMLRICTQPLSVVFLSFLLSFFLSCPPMRTSQGVVHACARASAAYKTLEQSQARQQTFRGPNTRTCTRYTTFSALVPDIMNVCIFLLLLSTLASGLASGLPQVTDERVVFQTKYGDVEFGFMPEVRLRDPT
jgi:hypothetical protein